MITHKQTGRIPHFAGIVDRPNHAYKNLLALTPNEQDY